MEGTNKFTFAIHYAFVYHVFFGFVVKNYRDSLEPIRDHLTPRLMFIR